MKKVEKRFVALFVIFASILSFLPIQIGQNGKAANAITTQIQVSGKSAETNAGSVKFINGEYATDERYDNFTLSVDYKIKSKTVTDIPIEKSGVIEQEVIITKIDGIQLEAPPDLDNVTDPNQADTLVNKVLKENNDKLDEIGVKINRGTEVITDKNGNKRIGITITGLPFGVNIIEYRIRERMTVNEGEKDTSSNDPNAKKSKFVDKSSEYYPSKSGSDTVVIQHANKFVQNKISPMTFNSYIGEKNKYDEKSETNKPPFLYSQIGIADANSPLRYNFDVSDAVSTLQYIMQFDPNVVPINSDTKVYKNGVIAGDITINNGAISGFLTDLGASDLIVVKLANNGEYVSKSYSIQLKYNTIDANKDYTLRDAGIKKLYFDADSNVKVYVSKHLETLKENGITTYKGKITIDRKAQMIGMSPVLGATTNIAYKLSNHYDNGLVENARIIGGQSTTYVNFQKGTNSNQLWLEVYEGQDGNIKQGSSALAVYKLDVELTGSESTVNLSFDNDNDHGNENKAYLTQPGRGKFNNITDKIDFRASRRTYDLNFIETDTTKINNVIITLNTPNTQDKNVRREYLKVWGGTSSQSDNVIEITDIIKGPEVSVDISNYKKIIVQAYYDQTIYEKDENGNGNDKPPKITAYPLGEKYTFYITKNPDSDGNNGNTKSSDASLTNIKVSNGTIKATDGTSGFSSKSKNYTVTVPKIDKSSAVTVTATNSKVKDISATIAETGDEYGLVSGEPFEFPLNTTGMTSIKIVVTAEDGSTTETYNLTINNDTRSASALLKNVITDNGDFTFDPEKDPNKIRVDQVINKLKVSPVAEQPNSRITVNGTKYTGSPMTIDLRGSQKTEMTITVTSEDGSASKTYNFEIYRTDLPINTGEDDNTEDVFYDEIDDCWVDLSKYEEWGSVDGKDVYFDKKGRQVKDRWIATNGVQYYLDSKGYKAKGWRKEVGGKTYYLDPSTGVVKTGWLNQNNKWYYLGLDGVMIRGWKEINGKWYYFTPEGEMITNQSMYIDDGIYRFGTDGIMY